MEAMTTPDSPTPPFPHSPTLPLIDWAVAARPLPGQLISGDLHVVAPFAAGALVGAVDGLGHGAKAAAAAAIAVATLAAHAHEPLLPLLKRCHEQLKGTRGVALSVASLRVQDNLMTWVGVGNVEGLLWHESANGQLSVEALPLRGGVVGYQLPPLHAFSLSVARGDCVIFASDGIRSSFAQTSSLRDLFRCHSQDELQPLADRILLQYGKDTDDALVLLVRYLGGTS
jgi:serine phosphatase RsbU (regulator of sigma subunit)